MKRLASNDASADAALSQSYIVLTVASCAIATLGLIENSVAVIIGAMIVAPLITPIQAFALAALGGDAPVVRRALVTAGVGALVAVVVSSALAVVTAIPAYGSEIVARTRPTLLDLAIAVAAGAVTGFARLRPGIANTVAGTAIAVALMPPLCVRHRACRRPVVVGKGRGAAVRHELPGNRARVHGRLRDRRPG
jgi:uncharacterized hydrophobic protein (TIGR00271 family)